MKDIPAFPSVGNPNCYPTFNSEGMTLRDYFAAKALQGMLAHDSLGVGSEEFKGFVNRSIRAYQFADAMLLEREKGR